MSKPKGLLVITELFAPTKGGTAVWFDEVYRKLGDKEIHILAGEVTGADEVDAIHPNTIHRIAFNRYGWLRPESLFIYLKLLFVGLGVVVRNRISAVHAGRVLPEGLVGWSIARMTRKPIIIYAHGEEITTWREAGKFRAMRFTYTHADQVIANSSFTQGELLKLGVPSERIVLISPGVDVDHFKPDLPANHLRESIGLREGQKLILSVGRLSRRKGFDHLIQALPRLLEKGLDVSYALIGIGEDHEYLLRQAQEHGVSDRVHLLGHVSTADLPLWYNACDLFAMPNRVVEGDTEGFGMVFLEAAACAKPVIAGVAGGTGAAVVEGVTGYRVEGEDVDQLVVALERLLSDGALSKRLGRAGHLRANLDFSWSAVVHKTRQLVL